MMDEEAERREMVFYEYFTDGGFKFGSDQILKVSTAVLAEKSPVFQKLFMDSSPDRVVEIKDYDCNTFKYFLDCLMDFQDYSVADTLVLFPMAWKYETKKFIKKCLDILKPKELDENVCLTLNLALCCNCDELRECVINFLKSEKLIYRIFHEAKFYAFLEPESVRELLQYIEMDSYIIRILFEWGDICLNQINNKFADLKSFFLENRITELMPVSAFETSQILFDFNDSELGRGFYLNNVQDYFRHYGDDVDIRKCSWLNIKAGEIHTENLAVKNFALLQHYNVLVKVYRSPVIFYQHSKNEITIKYNFELKICSNGFEIVSETHEREEITATLFKKRMCGVWVTSNNRSCMSNLELKIKYTFNYDCRILQRSPKNYDGNEFKPENLYFTDDVELELVKK